MGALIDIMPVTDELLDFYCLAFIPPDAAHYAVMQAKGEDDKYRRRHQPPTPELVARALTGPAPLSLAVTPMTKDGYARAAMLDIDQGGPQAVARVLAVATSLGLWGFAQLSQAGDHDGGHVYFPTSEPMPAELLYHLAARIQAAACVEGEAWPTRADLRLPLMPHMRAEGGPRRFPLLLQTGELIDASEPWHALADLRAAWHRNTPEAITQAVGELPELSPTNRQPIHKSKVDPFKGESVIEWYLDNHTLGEVLGSATETPVRSGAIRCPWHDDEHPSLVVWTHPNGHQVCRCFSRKSNCPAADMTFWDAFNVFCHLEGFTPSEGVKSLVERYGLGERRTLRQTVQPQAPRATPEAHAALIAARRSELADKLRNAATRRGELTVVKGVPGIGKTHTAAELVEVWQAQGRTVAIAAPTKDLAASEWASRLIHPHVWQARADICTCYADKGPGYVGKLEDAGFFVECIKEDCPYRTQARALAGRVGIFQHAHLTLPESKAGRALAMADLIIVDESPLNAILTERAATLGELHGLARRMGQDDPAWRVVNALAEIAHEHGRAADLYGPELLTRLAKKLGDVAQAVRTAQASTYANLQPIAPPDADPDTLPRQFLGRLLRALAHDATSQGNYLVTWGKTGMGWAWVWYDPASFLAHATNRLERPAVIVLDGSADLRVSERLYRGWPVHLVEVDAPMSPAVEVIQVTTGASTRRIVQDDNALENTARRVALVANHRGLTLDGLISYKAAAPVLGELLGIPPSRRLGYGAQRGKNTLEDARALPIVASPTAPPASIERKARALWYDDVPIDHTWQRVGTGFYQAVDARLEAVNRLHGPEELRQAIHRARPILATAPVTLLVFTPWPLAGLGFTPTATVDQLPYGNSQAARAALDTYRARRGLSPVSAERGGDVAVSPELAHEFRDSQSGIRNRISSPQIENPEIHLSVSPKLSPPLFSPPGKDPAPPPSPCCADCGEAATRHTPRGWLCEDCLDWHLSLLAAPPGVAATLAAA